jgi:DNA-binding CsgD family transcriptional regulator/tetratricopeptide (TPR) repeat protein
VAAQALCLWGQALFDLGRVPQQPLEVFREAVDLSSSYPAGKEYAAALGALTEAETQQGMRADAARHADEAVAAARTCGEDGAVSLALGSRSAAHVGEPSAIGDADECHRLAVAAHDAELVGLACLARADALDGCGRLVESADTLLQALSPEAAHAPGGLGPVLAARAADLLVDLGRFDEARAMLQEAMTSGAGAGQVMIRALQAGIRLSLRTGHTEEAAALLGRLQEHAPGFERHIGAHGPAALAEYLTWSGAPDEALAVLWSTLERHTRAEPRYGDAMVWWAARAAADWATHGRDDRDPAMARAAVTALERILRLRERLPGWVPARDGEDRVQRANRELLDAESARCRGETASCRWQSAADAAGEAGLQWARADALLRLAQARLVEGRGRGEVGLPLRECHGLAAGLGATPLREEAESLSRLARISLAPASIPEQTRRRLSLLDGLTRRETEVLGHLVAGRSYQEIAQSLFISEKTVSVHVSNLLRKTGTTSRVEVAAYARRHGVDAAD